MSADPAPATSQPPLRADARRNRDKIIEAARAAFHECGSDCSLDAIAKRAGVGAGTLYRHFPNREALIDEVMHSWADRIEADSNELIESGLPPREMLTAWFARFVENVGIYHGAAAKLMKAMDDETSPIYRKCQVLGAANARVLDCVREAGALRDDVQPREVMRMVSGIGVAVDQAGLQPDEAEPMLRMLLDGVLRPDAD